MVDVSSQAATATPPLTTTRSPAAAWSVRPEAAGAQKLAEESKKYAKLEAELSAKLEDASGKLDATRKRHISLSEKFAQREDVIVELRARMDEYERGVHGLREEVQEKERFKALHEQRSAEVRKMTSERNRREATLGHLRDETDAIDAMRDKPDALFKDGLVSRLG